MSEHIATVDAAETAGSRQPDPVAASGQGPGAMAEAEPKVEVTTQDLLVEEVSIDGMCGVY